MLNTDIHDIGKRITIRHTLALPFAERRMLLFFGDLLCLALAAWISVQSQVWFAGGYGMASGSAALAVFGVLAGAWLLLTAMNDGYDLQVAGCRRQVLVRLGSATVATAGIYLLVVFLAGRVPGSSGAGAGMFTDANVAVAGFLLALLALSATWRMGYIQLFTSTALRRRAIVVGAGKSGRALLRTVRPALHEYDIIGFVDDDPAKQGQHIEGLPVLGTRYKLAQLVRQLQVDEVILAITGDVHDDLFKMLLYCYEEGTLIRPMALVYEEVLGRVPVEHLGQRWFVAPFSAGAPVLYRSYKRLLDIVVALAGLIVLVPLLPLVALAIYLENPGPIFTRQERLGQSGTIFHLTRFRSLVWRNGTEHAPSLTRVGRLLRRTRLDDLPQLLNVLKGEMSLVGPRPEQPRLVEQFQAQFPLYRTRLSIKPGLTGWAQVRYHGAGGREDVRVKLEYDLFYIKYRSLLLDLLIILRTIGVVLGFRGV